MSKSASAATAAGNAASQWQDLRYVGAVPGRYALASSPLRPDGQLPVYACRLCSITPLEAVVIGPVPGKPGTLVSAHFDEFGVFRAKIDRVLQSGFVLDLLMAEEDRRKLATKLFLMRKKSHQPVNDRMDDGRVLPRDPRSTLTFADGARSPCFIVNMSCVGVTVSAEFVPEVGDALAVGKLVGRVAGHHDVGFTVAFTQEQKRDTLDAMLAPLA